MSQLNRQRLFASLALSVTLAGVGGCGGSLARAQDNLAVGNDTDAERHLRKALKSSSSRAEAGKLLSVLLVRRAEKLASDEPKAAEDLYREALSLDARNEAARTGLARLLMKRGFMKEASELLAAKGCSSCGRLIAMMTHQSADQAYAMNDILGARGLYQQAFEQGNDPLDALGMVRTFLVPAHRDLSQAIAALTAAAPLIAGGQVDAEAQFQDLRMQILVAAAEAHDNDMIEAVFKIKTYVLRDEPEFDLRFRISQEQFRAGDSDPAIERVTSLLTNYGQYIDPTTREVWNRALVIMYGARAAQHLQAGDPVGAVKDIGAGLKIDPENTRLKLQQALAIAGNGRLDLAMTTVDGLANSKDKTDVQAILYAQVVFESIEAGKMAKAYEALEKAQRLGPNLPETLLARAWVLAESRNEDIKKKDELADVRKLAGFSYPGGRINQFAGALAYLDLARRQVREQGVLHPFRGPGFETRANELKDKIKAFYPYQVTYFGGGGGMIELVSETGEKTAEYRGPRWLKGSAVASPGFPAEIPVKAVGLVYLDFDGKTVAVVVEEGTQITMNLDAGAAAPQPPAPAPAPAAAPAPAPEPTLEP
jgi:Tfp pilus assembly protein PilF